MLISEATKGQIARYIPILRNKSEGLWFVVRIVGLRNVYGRDEAEIQPIAGGGTVHVCLDGLEHLPEVSGYWTRQKGG